MEQSVRRIRYWVMLGIVVGALIALSVRYDEPTANAAPAPAPTPVHPATARARAASGIAQWTTAGPFADDATATSASPTYDTDHTAFLGVSYENNAGQATVEAVAAILRTTDGGTTWSTVWSSTVKGQQFNWLNQIVVSPTFTVDHTVFALSSGPPGGVIRSTDGGATFQPISIPSSPSFSATTKTLSMSPQFNADHTVAVTADATNTTVSYLSTDGGTTWNPVIPSALDSCGDVVSGGGFLLVLGTKTLGSYVPNASLVCSNNTDQLFAISHDTGANWAKGGDVQAAVGGANNFDTQHSRMVSPDGTSILYTDQYGNALRSPDGGVTWTNLIGPSSTLGHDAPIGAASQTGPYYNFQAKSGTKVYAVHEWYGVTPRYYLSNDGGATWLTGWQGNGITNLHGVTGAGAQTVFFAPGNLGLARSTDLGVTWQSVGSFQPQNSAVALSPNYANDQALFTVDYPSGVTTVGQDTAGFGIYRSTSGGAAWSEPEAPNAANAAQQGTIFTTAVHGGLSMAISPGFSSDHTVFEGDNIGAIAISHDAGATWTQSLIGTPPQAGWYVYGLVTSPNYPTDHTIYAGLGNLGFGVVKSPDGGQSWVSEVPADRFGQIADAAVHSLDASAELGGVVDLAIGMSTLFLARDTPSSSNPPEWLDAGFATAWTVVFSPNNQHDCTIYASKWPGPSGVGATLDDGVYVSTNACAANPPPTITWTRLTASLPVRDFSAIALSPNFSSDGTVVIGSYTAGVYVSNNGGQTWAAFDDGLGNLTIHKLAIASPAPRSGTLFAATDSGVWQTPLALIPGPSVYHAFLPGVMNRAH